MLPLESTRILITSSLLFAAAITWTCPCNPLLECHKVEFLAATLLPLGLFFVSNSKNEKPELSVE